MKKKTFKGRLKNKINLNQSIWKGKYAGIAIENGRVNENQIKATELGIKRTLTLAGGSWDLWIRIAPTIPVSKKPAEVRMGKGKGSIKYSMARVQAGTILFEMNTTNEILARKAFRVANSKLPIKLRFIKLIPTELSKII